MMRSLFLLVLCISFSFLVAQEKKEKTEKTEWLLPPLSITKHTLILKNGRTVNYTATSGYMLLETEEGKDKARMFYTAYVKDGVANVGERPITYTFNGGPGSSSVWLHMGALGPKRIMMKDDGASMAPPYQVVDNEHSWLDYTDLVFILSLIHILATIL